MPQRKNPAIRFNHYRVASIGKGPAIRLNDRNKQIKEKISFSSEPSDSCSEIRYEPPTPKHRQPVEITKLSQITSMQKISDDFCFNRAVFKNDDKVYKIIPDSKDPLGPEKASLEKDLILNSLYLKLHGGRFADLPPYKILEVEGVQVLEGPFLEGEEPETIPKSLLREMAKEGWYMGDLKPSNFIKLKDSGLILPIDGKSMSKDPQTEDYYHGQYVESGHRKHSPLLPFHNNEHKTSIQDPTESPKP
ncbi:hypothetical protein ACR9PT_14030 [Piscirickettsia salmonis]|uniref:hypothetical protein n=1 Tax=Piscirickettsia salmonis TaxID=1238 RepID=UPI003EBDFE5E